MRFLVQAAPTATRSLLAFSVSPRRRPGFATTVPHHRRNMTAAPAGPTPQQAKANGDKTEIKILMLHGYTQSGSLFRAKTRALEKLLVKLLAPSALLPTLIYATGPNRLLPSDIPGYQQPPSAGSEGGTLSDEAPPPPPDAWAWWRKDDATGTYRFFDEGMAAVAAAIRDAGGVDAVCGFSQGGAVTGVVAAALETGREAPDGPQGDWVHALREANGERALRFAVSYSGFYAPVERLAFCYEPKIETPTLHYIGSLDTVVDESRSQALVDRCVDPVVIVHPGGHHVPVSKEWAMPFAGFIKQHATLPQPKPGL
ncbi:Dihydrofolate reductase [Purpureocillium takamizusanense]|uniref:Dihydrofolate reductase n=1 Tax=Purpureocillium takamizusanense TaxID=2060973 RepID=A0A9Q8V6F0_9HYPO|nr:Dihydrofolate reductase [Purpureocillium takamizusanense]UNI13727.1 Dihydrofolate reductase [Purpureocillium takamizusanense]